MEWIWIILGIVVLLGILLPSIVVPLVVFIKVFVRTSKKKWDYSCQDESDPEQVEMYRIATEWAERYRENRRSLRIENDGYGLSGEYYDFGGDRAVLVIAGRTEACRYSCYFAEPYRRAGYNVLTIDNRSHGFSDGRVNTLGFREYRDIQVWIRLLREELQNHKVICHGICIGSATALYALTDADCPDSADGLVADGMYMNFGESFKNHLIERNKPIFPCYQVCMWMEGLFAGHNPGKYGPQDVIAKMNRPMLFLHGRQDMYSVPEKAQWLYEHCGSSLKKLVWFDEGRHSFLRFHAPEKYDETVMAFLEEMDADKTAERS